MEEEKAAAYYDELSRKGSGAARFKQGLGFSSSSPAADPPPRGPALASSFLTQFVKASNPNSAKAETDTEKPKSHIESIQNKLRKKVSSSVEPQFKDRDRDNDKRNDWDRERHSRKIRSTERRSRRSRSRSRSCEDRDKRRDRERQRRSRSRSFSDEESKRRRERRRRSRRRSRSLSPGYESSQKGKGDRKTGRRSVNSNNGAIDYTKLIKGYDDMTPAERVKAKMKLQLSETAAKDTRIGTSGWERFDFNKDAPLDNDEEEIEGADDDTNVVKNIGQTFRFSNVQARRAEEIQAAHDEAMFGVPVCLPSIESESVEESEIVQSHIESNDVADTSLFSDKLLSKKQGSWRDRAPRNIN